MTEPTIRQRMLDQQKRHPAWNGPRYDFCQTCGQEWPCPDRVAADAVLATLNAANRLGNLRQRIYPADDHVAVLDPDGVPVRDEATP